jgi:hypothetical protein
MCYKRFLNICLVAATIGVILVGVIVLFDNSKGGHEHPITRERLPHFEAYYEQSVRGPNDVPDWLHALGCRHAFRDSDGNLLLVFKASVFAESGLYRFGGIAAPRAGVAEPRILRSRQIVDHWFSYGAD